MLGRSLLAAVSVEAMKCFVPMRDDKWVETNETDVRSRRRTVPVSP